MIKMVKVLQDYPQTVAITATGMREAKRWAKNKGYNEKTVESSGLGKAKRKAFFGTSSKVYVVAKR